MDILTNLLDIKITVLLIIKSTAFIADIKYQRAEEEVKIPSLAEI